MSTPNIKYIDLVNDNSVFSKVKFIDFQQLYKTPNILSLNTSNFIDSDYYTLHIHVIDQYGNAISNAKCIIKYDIYSQVSYTNNYGYCKINHYIGHANTLYIIHDNIITYTKVFSDSENNNTNLILNLDVIKSILFIKKNNNYLEYKKNIYDNLIYEFDYRKGLSLQNNTLNIVSYKNDKYSSSTGTVLDNYTLNNGIKRGDSSVYGIEISLNNNIWVFNDFTIRSLFTFKYDINNLTQTIFELIDTTSTPFYPFRLYTYNRHVEVVIYNGIDYVYSIFQLELLIDDDYELVLIKKDNTLNLVINNILCEKITFNGNPYAYYTGLRGSIAGRIVNTAQFQNEFRYFSLKIGALNLSSTNIGTKIYFEDIPIKSLFKFDSNNIEKDTNNNITYWNGFKKLSSALSVKNINKKITCKQFTTGQNENGFTINSKYSEILTLKQKGILRVNFEVYSITGYSFTLSKRTDSTLNTSWSIVVNEDKIQFYNLSQSYDILTSIQLNTIYEILIYTKQDLSLDIYINGVFKNNIIAGNFDFSDNIGIFEYNNNTNQNSAIYNIDFFLGNQFNLPNSPTIEKKYFEPLNFKTELMKYEYSSIFHYYNKDIECDLINNKVSKVYNTNNVSNYLLQSNTSLQPLLSSDGSIYSDGNNQLLRSNIPINLASTYLTIGCWFKVTNTTGMLLTIVDTNYTGIIIERDSLNSISVASVYNYSVIESSILNVYSNKWFYFTIIKNNNIYYLCINGKHVGTLSDVSSISLNSVYISILGETGYAPTAAFKDLIITNKMLFNKAGYSNDNYWFNIPYKFKENYVSNQWIDTFKYNISDVLLSLHSRNNLVLSGSDIVSIQCYFTNSTYTPTDNGVTYVYGDGITITSSNSLSGTINLSQLNCEYTLGCWIYASNSIANEFLLDFNGSILSSIYLNTNGNLCLKYGSTMEVVKSTSIFTNSTWNYVSIHCIIYNSIYRTFLCINGIIEGYADLNFLYNSSNSICYLKGINTTSVYRKYDALSIVKYNKYSINYNSVIGNRLFMTPKRNSL